MANIISDKYLAGLIDSDGSIGWTNIQQGVKPSLRLMVTQLSWRSKILEDLKERVSFCFHAVSLRSPLPILFNFLIEEIFLSWQFALL